MRTFLAFLTAGVSGALAGCASLPPADPPQAISVEVIHMTAGGKFVDLRYRVLDAEQATAQLGKKVRPKLIDERTGTEMSVPMTAKLGALRQTQGAQKTGRTYFILFANNGSVAKGSKVTAQIGPMSFHHLVVE
jgi:hypothetical protein